MGDYFSSVCDGPILQIHILTDILSALCRLAFECQHGIFLDFHEGIPESFQC